MLQLIKKGRSVAALSFEFKKSAPLKNGCLMLSNLKSGALVSNSTPFFPPLIIASKVYEFKHLEPFTMNFHSRGFVPIPYLKTSTGQWNGRIFQSCLAIYSKMAGSGARQPSTLQSSARHQGSPQKQRTMAPEFLPRRQPLS